MKQRAGPSLMEVWRRRRRRVCMKVEAPAARHTNIFEWTRIRRKCMALHVKQCAFETIRIRKQFLRATLVDCRRESNCSLSLWSNLESLHWNPEWEWSFFAGKVWISLAALPSFPEEQQSPPPPPLPASLFFTRDEERSKTDFQGVFLRRLYSSRSVSSSNYCHRWWWKSMMQMKKAPPLQNTLIAEVSCCPTVMQQHITIKHLQFPTKRSSPCMWM